MKHSKINILHKITLYKTPLHIENKQTADKEILSFFDKKNVKKD